MLLPLPLIATLEMAAAKASPSSPHDTTLPLPWWMAKLLLSLISLVAHLRKISPVQLFAFLPRPWKTRELFASVISLVNMDTVKGPHEVPLTRPPLPWMTRLFVSIVSFFTDAVRRPDGTVRRFLSRLDITVGPDANPAHGVRTADVTIDPSRGLWFRLFLPASHVGTEGKLPVVVFFHGGGFAFLSPASLSYDAVCRRICREQRVVVVSVNYRLSPEHRCPAPYDDGVDVLRFLDSYPCNYDGFSKGRPSGKLLHFFFGIADFSNCFLAGDSAGANIAHHVARQWTAREPSPPCRRVRLAGLVAIQPFFGGEERVESEVRLARAPLVNTERTDWLWRAFLPVGADRDHEAASPAAAVLELGEGFPPAMVVAGGFDPLQDWQRRYVECLRKKGKEVWLVEYPAAVHGFYVLPGLGASASPLMEEMKRFIEKQLTAAVDGNVAGKRLHGPTVGLEY